MTTRKPKKQKAVKRSYFTFDFNEFLNRHVPIIHKRKTVNYVKSKRRRK